MPQTDAVSQFPSPGPPGRGVGNGGNGRRFNDRLLSLEKQVAGLDSKLDTELKHLATKKDVEEIKTLISQRESAMLKWLVGLVVVGLASIAAALIRTFVN